MKRRDFLACAGTLVCGAGRAAGAPGRAAAPPRVVAAGPQLLLDDFWIDAIHGLKRELQHPERLPQPVLTSGGFGVTQPYLTVLRDRDAGRFRLWYNRGPAVWHTGSTDGIHWDPPRVAWDLPRGYGCSLVDDGPGAADPARRFKLANWQATRGREDRPGDDGGMWVGFSPDGLRWTAHDRNPVLPTWPEGYGTPSRRGVGDTVDVAFDPLLGRYAAAVKVHAVPEDGYAPGPKSGRGIRRLVGMSTSADFVHWDEAWRIHAPDAQDDGLLEFYGMGGMHLRGPLRIGLVRVLRDDLPCDPGGPKDGIGSTVLATSRDGKTWTRLREPFLDRDPEPGRWDHAMAWMSAAVPVGDEMFFYYGGYARGHKIAPATERQVGLARLKRDRYAAIVPVDGEGTLTTPPLVLPDGELTLNARSRGPAGGVRVRLLDAAGQPAATLGTADARPVTGDVLAGAVRWPRPLATLRGTPVRLEFRVRDAALFGFEFRG